MASSVFQGHLFFAENGVNTKVGCSIFILKYTVY